MKKINRLKFIISMLVIYIIVLITIIFVLLIGKNRLIDNDIINNFSFIMQTLSYIATIVGVVSIVFAYIRYKNTIIEKNNKVSGETVKLLDDFTTKVMLDIDRIDKEHRKLQNKNRKRKKKNKSTIKHIKGKAIDNCNNEMNYINLWCRCLLIFKNRNMIQEDILYSEASYAFIEFINFYKGGLEYKDPAGKYYKGIYNIYNRWTRTI